MYKGDFFMKSKKSLAACMSIFAAILILVFVSAKFNINILSHKSKGVKSASPKEYVISTTVKGSSASTNKSKSSDDSSDNNTTDGNGLDDNSSDNNSPDNNDADNTTDSNDTDNTTDSNDAGNTTDSNDAESKEKSQESNNFSLIVIDQNNVPVTGAKVRVKPDSRSQFADGRGEISWKSDETGQGQELNDLLIKNNEYDIYVKAPKSYQKVHEKNKINLKVSKNGKTIIVSAKNSKNSAPLECKAKNNTIYIKLHKILAKPYIYVTTTGEYNDTSEGIPGVQFSLYQYNGATIDPTTDIKIFDFITDDKGIVDFGILNDSVSNPVYNNTCLNYGLPVGSYYFVQTGTGGVGYEMKLDNGKEKYFTFVVGKNDDGKNIVVGDNVDVGKYHVKKITDKLVKSNSISIMPKPGTIKVTKEKVDDMSVAGTIFTLYEMKQGEYTMAKRKGEKLADAGIQAAADENGTATFENLDWNKKYFVKETTASKGYKVNQLSVGTGDNGQNAIVFGKDTVEADAYVKSKITRVLIQCSGEQLDGNSKDLSNVEFVIAGSKGSFLDPDIDNITVKSNETGTVEIAKELVAGKTYTIEEKVDSLKENGNYNPITQTKFKLSNSGSEVVLFKSDDMVEGKAISVDQSLKTRLKIKNWLNRFYITKENGDDEKLKGAEVQIEDEQSQPVEGQRYEMNGNSIEVSNLTPGKYRIREVKAPEGYIINQKPINFTLNPDNTVRYNSEILGNKCTTTKSKCPKIALESKKTSVCFGVAEEKSVQINAKKAKSASYIIKAEGKKDIEVSGEQIVNGSKFNGRFVAGVEYSLNQKDAPLGYNTVDEVKFTLDENTGKIKVLSNNDGTWQVDEESNKLVIVDSPTRFNFVKEDEDGNKMDNVELVIKPYGKSAFAENDDGEIRWVAGVDVDAAVGKEVQGELIGGNVYVLSENTPKEGYRSADPIYFRLNSSTRDLEIGKINKKTKKFVPSSEREDVFYDDYGKILTVINEKTEFSIDIDKYATTEAKEAIEKATSVKIKLMPEVGSDFLNINDENYVFQKDSKGNDIIVWNENEDKLKVNGQLIGENSYVLRKYADDKVVQELNLEVSENGRKVKIKKIK